MKTFISLFIPCLFLPSVFVGCKKDIGSNSDPYVQLIVGDAQGNQYDTVVIGTQVWTTKNLQALTYNNSNNDPSSNDAPRGVGSLDTIESSYDTVAEVMDNPNNTSPGYPYGYLYNWYAAKNPGIAVFLTNENSHPFTQYVDEGWRVPTSADWTKLCTYIGDSVGYKLNTVYSASGMEGYSFWLPTGVFILGDGIDFGDGTGWWCSDNISQYFSVNPHNTSANLYDAPKTSGISIRCVRDR